MSWDDRCEYPDHPAPGAQRDPFSLPTIDSHDRVVAHPDSMKLGIR